MSAGVATPDVASRRIEVRDGTELTIDVLRWDEGWDFDGPVCVLRPVIRFSPNGESAEHMVEDLCLNAAVDGFLTCEGTERGGLVDRQFPLASLKHRWAAARRGVHFPVKGYTASRFHVRFFATADDLDYHITKEVAR